MNNEVVQERLKLAVELRNASDRYAQISQEFADQAFEINREVEDHYAAQNARTEASEAVRRPTSLRVMEPRQQPSFQRVAAAVAVDRLVVEAETQHRRSTIADRDGLVIDAPDIAEKPRLLRRISEWWTARYAEPSLPARY